MDTLTGHQWRLFVDGTAAATQEISQRLNLPFHLNVVTIGGIGLQERNGIAARWFKHQGCIAALVRPDHYVYGVADTLENLESLLREQATAYA